MSNADTQYRIYEQLTDGRLYVSTAYVDPLGRALFSWSDRKSARLFTGTAEAERIARAIEAEIELRGFGKQTLKIAPATGGMTKTRKRA